MERFLIQCAKYIGNKHAKNLENICLVFPNRRAGVFFRAYLQKQIENAVIGPKITTINELISSFSDYQQGEKLQLISILYDVFVKHTHSTELFDDFYFWGEILLSDFNDIDRYLVDAKDLFTNIYDIKEIESVFDYLDEEQKKALEHFWGSVVAGKNKEFEKKYLNIWEKLYPVYSDFKTKLHSENIAFGGMSDRSVIEKLEQGSISFKYEKYYFIGLNAINNCEKKLFEFLKKEGLAGFLWDESDSYINNKKNEAGYFLRKNRMLFPAPDDFILSANHEKKNIKLIAVSSVSGQTQQIPFFVDECIKNKSINFDSTAIVLADESLLFPALGAIPSDIEKINITMGYPVKNSVVYGFLLLLINLLKNTKIKNGVNTVYYRYVTDVLNHQLLAGVESEKCKQFLSEIKKNNTITVDLNDIDISPLHKTIFSIPAGVNNYSAYFLEVVKAIFNLVNKNENHDKMLLELIYSIYKAVEKLQHVVEDVKNKSKREINHQVYFRLFNQFIGQESVAFEGEPLNGLQVMGILETRCLDFENLIIIGLNENKWPRTFTAPSFIPYNIRKGFGLPGIDEQDAMYAYYFYRLIERAKNVTATYSAVKEGISTGELSRYGYQLMYGTEQNPKTETLDFVFANDPVKPIQITSTKQHVDALIERNKAKPLSPSAINTYINCSLKFYFKYLAHIKEPDEVKEEIDGMTFGNVFHGVMENLYKDFIGKEITKENIEKIKANKSAEIDNEIYKQIADKYFNKKNVKNYTLNLQGKSLLIFESIKTFVLQLLELDKKLAPFTVVALEQKCNTAVNIVANKNNIAVNLGGIIDRVDRKNGNLRIVDYKTGRVDKLKLENLEELFENKKSHKKEILQALIYSFIYRSTNKIPITPAIYSIGNFYKSDFSPTILYDKEELEFSFIENEFKELLTELITTIFSEGNVFKQTEETDSCQYCPYLSICQRD